MTVIEFNFTDFVVCRFNRDQRFWRILRRRKEQCLGDSESQEFAGGRKQWSEIPASPKNRRFLALHVAGKCTMMSLCRVHLYDSVGGARTAHGNSVSNTYHSFCVQMQFMPVNLLFSKSSACAIYNNSFLVFH